MCLNITFKLLRKEGKLKQRRKWNIYPEGRHMETITTETHQSKHTRTTALSNSVKLSHACGAT